MAPRYKHCPGCCDPHDKSDTLPIHCFSKDKTQADGYAVYCDECIEIGIINPTPSYPASVKKKPGRQPKQVEKTTPKPDIATPKAEKKQPPKYDLTKFKKITIEHRIIATPCANCTKKTIAFNQAAMKEFKELANADRFDVHMMRGDKKAVIVFIPMGKESGEFKANRTKKYSSITSLQLMRQLKIKDGRYPVSSQDGVLVIEADNEVAK